MTKIDLTRVKEALIRREEILFAYIFGSAAEQRDSELSDVDIAVYLDPSLPRTRMLEILAEIASELGPRIKVDLALLNTASPSLAFEAIRGKPVVVR
ncbi:MAG: nucleotidyltransferase domain-containing protein, partial [Candidatus Korarchaeota archaeon]|nr:nucleotidyltransferase domain-containing protein [Candidatus Korarchaeota archaeon]